MPIPINDWFSIPDEFVEVKFTRAGGPGGQNVNKVSSRAEVLVRLEGFAALPAYAREKLEARERNRISKEGVLRLVCQESRDQATNRDTCFEKLRALVAECLERPPERRPTKPSRAARARRVEGKRRRSDIKKMRGGVHE
jgi:ribosome-associated protein